MDLLKKLAAPLTALLLSPAAGASAWTLVDCPPEVVKTWAPQEAAFRAAKPGDPLYLPRLFPKATEEVLEDYRYEFQRLLKDTPSASLPNGAAAVLEGIRKGALRYDVLRIVNWSPTRCLKERRLDAYHLIRVFDGRTGVEITRSVLDESGRLTVITSTLEGGRHLRSPADELRSAASRFKVQGQDPQYVTTFGTLRCANITPCLVFRNGGRVYLDSYDGNLFEIDLKGRRLEMGKDIGTPEMNEPILKALGPDGRLVSLGGKVFVTARKVKGSRDLKDFRDGRDKHGQTRTNTDRHGQSSLSLCCPCWSVLVPVSGPLTPPRDTPPPNRPGLRPGRRRAPPAPRRRPRGRPRPSCPA